MKLLLGILATIFASSANAGDGPYYVFNCKASDFKIEGVIGEVSYYADINLTTNSGKLAITPSTAPKGTIESNFIADLKNKVFVVMSEDLTIHRYIHFYAIPSSFKNPKKRTYTFQAVASAADSAFPTGSRTVSCEMTVQDSL